VIEGPISPPSPETSGAPSPPRPLVDLDITSLDAGGCGRADHGGVVVRVPLSLPGERVRAAIWRLRDGQGDADLVEVVRAAPERTAPPCQLFGQCGGCQVQHLAYEGQLAWKTGVVRDLVAGARLDVGVAACEGSPRQLGYRSKITPHHDYPRPDRPVPIGFLRVGRRHEVVDVPSCPLATDGINERLPSFRAEIAAAATKRRKGASFVLRETAGGVTTDPDARVTERVGALSLEFFAREFFQNNPFLLPRLLDHVIAAAAGDGARHLVDAYSGSGLFALAAASRFVTVVGVEVSAGAVIAARENATRNHLTNVTFSAANAATIFAGLPFAGSEAAVIIDPPRKGCDEAFLGQLLGFGPRTIVYVSCNPESLTRDLALLLPSYRALPLQPFDMFPQTRHIETVATLTRIPEAGLTRAPGITAP
jgi:tRNA/tmRNA/rRNA uracil-C5-methylase (TrmA/RlmC/RlmD family)